MLPSARIELDRRRDGMTASPQILVVDDERFFREGIRDALAAAGFACATAATGAEALERASDPGIGVVVLDIVLPGLDGLEVLRRLRERQPELRVLILSAYTDQERVLEALRLGAFDYLAKPLHDEELVLAVRRALESHALGQGLLRLRTRIGALDRSLSDLAGLAAADVDEEGRQSVLRARAAAAVAEVLEAGKTSLLLLSEDGAHLRVVAATGRKQPLEEFDVVPLGTGVAGFALARSEPIVVNDVAADPRFASRIVAGRYDSASFAMAPVTHGERTIGVLCATDRTSGRPFEESDVALLRILALQLGQALQPAPAAAVEVLDPGGPHEEELAELVRRICDAATAEIEPGRLLAAALAPIAEAFSAAPVSLYLRDATTGELVLESQCDGARCSDRARLPRSRGLTAAVLETGRLVATGSPAADPRFDPDVDTPEGSAAAPLLCLPIRLRGKVLGVARIFPGEARHCSARAGEVLSAALSAAIRNVLLYRSLLEAIEEVARVRREAQAS
jgi:DNA-binding response OmpR family regulator